jgi:predicted tellurium resistance membrane protein TerC
MDLLTDPASWVAFSTLLLLEVVLGIDNVIFISILAGKLPEEERKKARSMGLGLALVSRIGLLASLSFLVGLTKPLFMVRAHEVSGRDLVLIAGGFFLIAKSTHEIHSKIEGDDEERLKNRKRVSFMSIILQILVLDMVFSLDSVITAVGMVDELPIMVAAVLVSTVIMIFAAGGIAGFVERHPTVKMLALSFLLMIGLTLVVEGFDHHIPKGYVYVAMGFSMFVEFLNLRMRKKSKA